MAPTARAWLRGSRPFPSSVPRLPSPASLLQRGVSTGASLEKLCALGLPAGNCKAGFLLGSCNLVWRQQEPTPAQLKGSRPPGPAMGPVGEGGAHKHGSASAKVLLLSVCTHSASVYTMPPPSRQLPQGGIIVANSQTRMLRLRKVRNYRKVKTTQREPSSDCFGSHAVFLTLELGKEKAPRW